MMRTVRRAGTAGTAELEGEAAAGGVKARRRLAPSCGSAYLDDEAMKSAIPYLCVWWWCAKKRANTSAGK
jgi:hypothetical protein